MTLAIYRTLADPAQALQQYGLTLQAEPFPADAVILAVAHDGYRASGWPLITSLLEHGRGLVMDVKSALDPLERPAASYGAFDRSPALPLCRLTFCDGTA